MSAPIARPDMVFEANFFDTLDGSNWTDLSSYVELDQGINVSRRRQLIFDEVSAGSLGISLDNSAGTFNNDRSDLPYAGLIDIDVPVRLRARWPNVPSGTVNMLSDNESVAQNTNYYVSEQGTLDLEVTTPPAGQTSAVIWSTGVLQTTGVHLLTGDLFARSADDVLPMFVTGSTQYTAGAQVKGDTNATGISFQVAATILWYDYTGLLISESVGTPVTLTTSYQTISVTATSPSNAATARMSFVNNTLVKPASAAFALTGIDSNQVNNGARMARLTIPPSANVGDYALAYHRSNKTATFSIPTGWTQIDSFNDGRGTTQVCGKFLTQADLGMPVFWDVGATGFIWSSVLCTFSGASPTSTINAHSTKTETTLTVSHVSNTVVTTTANCLIVTFTGDTSNTTGTWNTPSGETLVNQVFGKGGNSTSGTVTYKQATTAGTYGGITTVSNLKSQFAGMSTVAIAPAVGTGPGTVNVTAGAWQMVQGASLGSWAIGGHWKELFDGLTDSWTKAFDGDLSLMVVAATDSSKTLNANTVGSATYETIMQAGPIAYYQLDESGQQSTTVGANSAPVQQGAMTPTQFSSGGSLSWGNGTGPAVDGQSAVTTTKASRTAGVGLVASLTNPITDSDSASLSIWWASSDSDTSGPLTMAKLVNIGTGSTQWAYLQLWGTSGSNMNAQCTIFNENTTYGAVATWSHQVFDGKTHLLNATAQLVAGTLVVILYVDGVQEATTTIACPLTTIPVLNTFDVGTAYAPPQLLSGTFSHAAAFNWALDSDTIANLYTAGTTAFAGETVDQRIGRIADWSNVDALDLDTSVTVCDRHMPDTQTVLAAIQQAARTDGGTSFVSDDGSITFRSRSNKESTFTPWLTLDVKYVAPSLTEVIDDQLLLNQVVVNRLGANTSTTTQSLPSQVLHGTYTKSIDTIMQNPIDAQYCGDYFIAFYSTPGERCDQVIIDGLYINQWPVLLTQDMWLIIHLTNLPSIEHSSTLDLYVEGWAIDIDTDQWQYTFDTSSSIPFAVVNDSVRDITGNVVVAW